MAETFEQMVERVLTEFGFLTQGMKEQISTRLREELAKGQEPDCFAVLTPNGSRLVSPQEAKGNKKSYPLYARPFVAAPSGVPDFEPDAKRLALELECLLLECKDMAAVSKWWDSAHEALEQHRALLSAAYSAPADAVAKDAEQTKAAADVLAERKRQQEVEGWTPEHDDEHANGELAEAAAAYASEAAQTHGGLPMGWPWAKEWWKPKDSRRNLVKAGALILAEIERLDRAAMQGKESGK